MPQFNRLNADVRRGRPARAELAAQPARLRRRAARHRRRRGHRHALHAPGGVADVPDATNPHNAGQPARRRLGPGGGTLRDLRPARDADDELSHNLGAVQAGAPHTTDPSNGGSLHRRAGPHALRRRRPEHTLTYTCDYRSSQTIDETYDCGHDDYFNPARPGLVPGDAWNIFNSEHLAGLLGSGRRAVAAATLKIILPVNTTPLPRPSGTRRHISCHAVGHRQRVLGVDRMQWQVDGGAVNDVGNGDVITISTSGAHTLSTLSRRRLQRPPPGGDYTVKVDVTKPERITNPGGAGDRRRRRRGHRDRLPPASCIVVEARRRHRHAAANATDYRISGDGDRSASVRGVDVAGNVADWKDHTIRLDTVLPSDETSAPSGWQTAPLGVTVTGSDALLGVCQVSHTGSTAAAGHRRPATVTVSGNGEHAETYATDAAGTSPAGRPPPSTSTPACSPGDASSTAPGAAQPSWCSSGADDVSCLREVQWRVDSGSASRAASSQRPRGRQRRPPVRRHAPARTTRASTSGSRDDDVRIDNLPPVNTTPTPAATVGTPYSVAVDGHDTLAGTTTSSGRSIPCWHHPPWARS